MVILPWLNSYIRNYLVRKIAMYEIFLANKSNFVLFVQLCSSKSGVFAPSSALAKAGKVNVLMGKGRVGRMRVSCQATSIPADNVPDMEKRKLLNLLLLGAISLPSGFMLVPYTNFFVPPG